MARIYVKKPIQTNEDAHSMYDTEGCIGGFKKKKIICGTAAKYNLLHTTLFYRVQKAKEKCPNIAEYSDTNCSDSGNTSDDSALVVAERQGVNKHNRRHYFKRTAQICYGMTYTKML